MISFHLNISSFVMVYLSINFEKRVNRNNNKISTTQENVFSLLITVLALINEPTTKAKIKATLLGVLLIFYISSLIDHNIHGQK